MTLLAAPAPAAKTPFAVEVITCVPDAWPAWLAGNTGLVGRAFAEGRASLHVSSLREHGRGKHRNVDDAPYGGGAGMVLGVAPVASAIAAARARTQGPVVLLAPRGRPLSQAKLRSWAEGPGLTLVCGRYEGLDERCYGLADEVISLGDFILSGGDPAALCVVDGVVRLRQGVLGNAASSADESFADGLLAYPQYTRPTAFAGEEVPEVLRGGDHAAVVRYRAAESRRLTQHHRPDLWALWCAKNPPRRP